MTLVMQHVKPYKTSLSSYVNCELPSPSSSRLGRILVPKMTLNGYNDNTRPVTLTSNLNAFDHCLEVMDSISVRIEIYSF